ncbi:hypothetical protein A2W24_06720 [Microgenomates group bacterium RBG_16_45_19]|nr:MAG: hypothetical protein A2W24_06720 [Microgenomates group bacterium RBG_16_45_19]
MPPTAFIDTNVWFSAFYCSPNAQRIITAHLHGKIQAVISPQVLTELITNVKLKIPQALSPLENFLNLSPPMIIKNPATIPVPIKSLAHHHDAPLLTACYLAKIPYFITGNTKDFNIRAIKTKLKIDVLTPNQAVKLWHF